MNKVAVCLNRSDGKVHRVKWNGGNIWCLTCNIPATTITRDELEKEERK